MKNYGKTLAMTFLVAILAMALVATAASANQNAEAATILAKNLLPDTSATWKISSSGKQSPDHRWLVVHPGYGYAQVIDSSGTKILQLRPKITDDLRHSTLVTPVGVTMVGIHGKAQVRLDKLSASPKPWDTFWMGLAYVDKTTHITLMIRNNDGGGWEVSKRDHDHVGQDLHQAIAQGTSIPYAPIGHWFNIEWWVYPHNGTLHIKVIVDGKLLVDKDDHAKWDRDGQIGYGTSTYFLNAKKFFSAYSEKSYTSWRAISVESYT